MIIILYAYSDKTKCAVCADDIRDLSETFSCLNPMCSAKFKVKGINSNVKTHFCRIRSSYHSPNCPFAMCSDKYVENDNILKSDVLSIMNHTSTSNRSKPYTDHENPFNTITDENSKIYIRTPKQLLNYCISNKLSTIYSGDIKVDDIILDKRNIIENKNFEGVSGLRLVLGNLVQYDLSQCMFQFRVTHITNTGKNIYLTANVFTQIDQLNELINYVIKTYKKFKGHPIAVLGDWVVQRKYVIKTTVSNPKNIVYRFTAI